MYGRIKTTVSQAITTLVINLGLLLFLIGCAAAPEPSLPTVTAPPLAPAMSVAPTVEDPNRALTVGEVPMVVWAEDLLNAGVIHWKEEALKRFHRPAILVCHGAEDQDAGPPFWLISPRGGITAEEAIADMKEEFPTHTIVIVACNPYGETINFPGVYYATTWVWSKPYDKWVGMDYINATAYPRHTASIFQFVSGDDWKEQAEKTRRKRAEAQTRYTQVPYSHEFWKDMEDDQHP
jgi:hypothetical protein